MNKIYPANAELFNIGAIEILDNDISIPIAELLNIDITEQMKNTLENIATMVSTNTHT